MRKIAMMLVLFLLFPAAAPAQQKVLPFKPDPVRGLVLAEKLCASCHLVKAGQQTPVEPGVPPFDYIANKPEQSYHNLRAAMFHPFPPMIDLHLTVHEVKDLSAYILSLKK